MRGDSSHDYSVRHSTRPRTGSGPYWYDVLDGDRVIARFWHDYRGDDNGIVFLDGSSEQWPAGGGASSFLSGGGREPLRLSSVAVEHLDHRAAASRSKPSVISIADVFALYKGE